jgi:hypothetical protein
MKNKEDAAKMVERQAADLLKTKEEVEASKTASSKVADLLKASVKEWEVVSEDKLKLVN